MTEKGNKKKFSELRKRARRYLAEHPRIEPSSPQEDIKKLISELDTFQIELELQNEELQAAQIEIEKSRQKYIDLYDYAPVGYLTINKKGRIVEANLTAAEMLRVTREHLLHTHLTDFIEKDDQDIFFKHGLNVQETKERQSCELRMRRKDGQIFSVDMQSIMRPAHGRTAK